MTRDEAKERVARGAAMLDLKRPGWERRIDVGTLTLWDPCGCIVGQLHDRQFDLVALGLPDTYEAGYQHGFSLATDSFDKKAVIAAWALLQDAWIEAIADRLVTAPDLVLVPVSDEAEA